MVEEITKSVKKNAKKSVPVKKKRRKKRKIQKEKLISSPTVKKHDKEMSLLVTVSEMFNTMSNDGVHRIISYLAAKYDVSIG